MSTTAAPEQQYIVMERDYLERETTRGKPFNYKLEADIAARQLNSMQSPLSSRKSYFFVREHRS